MVALIIGLLIAIPVVAVVALGMAINMGGRMRRLEARFAALEGRVAGEATGLAPVSYTHLTLPTTPYV